MIDIDITGNWHAEGGHMPSIQAHEPALTAGQAQEFWQELGGIGDGAIVHLAYPSSLHEVYGYPLTGESGPSDYLLVDDEPIPLRWERGAAGGDESYVVVAPFPPREPGATVSLHFAWRCGRRPRTSIHGPATDTHPSAFQALGAPGSDLLLAHGVPFRSAGIRSAPMQFWPQPPGWTTARSRPGTARRWMPAERGSTRSISSG